MCLTLGLRVYMLYFAASENVGFMSTLAHLSASFFAIRNITKKDKLCFFLFSNEQFLRLYERKKKWNNHKITVHLAWQIFAVFLCHFHHFVAASTTSIWSLCNSCESYEFVRDWFKFSRRCWMDELSSGAADPYQTKPTENHARSPRKCF